MRLHDYLNLFVPIVLMKYLKTKMYDIINTLKSNLDQRPHRKNSVLGRVKRKT